MTYRALRTGFADNRRIREGEIFTWDGPRGKWMEPLDEAKAEDSREPKRKAQKADLKSLAQAGQEIAPIP